MLFYYLNVNKTNSFHINIIPYLVIFNHFLFEMHFTFFQCFLIELHLSLFARHSSSSLSHFLCLFISSLSLPVQLLLSLSSPPHFLLSFSPLSLSLCLFFCPPPSLSLSLSVCPSLSILSLFSSFFSVLVLSGGSDVSKIPCL